MPEVITAQRETKLTCTLGLKREYVPAREACTMVHDRPSYMATTY